MLMPWNLQDTMFRIVDTDNVDIKVNTVVTTDLVARLVEHRLIKVVDANQQTPVVVTMYGTAIVISLEVAAVVLKCTRVITGSPKQDVKAVVNQDVKLSVLQKLVVIRTLCAHAMDIDTARPAVVKPALAA